VSYLTAKIIDLVVACGGFLVIVHIFHTCSGYTLIAEVLSLTVHFSKWYAVVMLLVYTDDFPCSILLFLMFVFLRVDIYLFRTGDDG